MADCGGLMEPIRIEYNSKKGYQIVHRCLTCGHIGRNIVLRDVAVQPDDEGAIFHLMRHPKA